MRNKLSKCILLVMFAFASCGDGNKTEETSFGIATIITEDKLTLENGLVGMEWGISNKRLHWGKVHNKKEGSLKEMDSVDIFKIHTKNSVLSNKNFKMVAPIKKSVLKPTDSLPTFSLGEHGIKLTTTLQDDKGQLQIDWSVTLRENSNYIRQSIEVVPLVDSIYIDKVSFFDGSMPGAKLVGNVLGSPFVANNFFFNYERPTAQTDALKKVMLKHYYDPEELEPKSGDRFVLRIPINENVLPEEEFIINYLPDRTSKEFNIHRMMLLENGTIVSGDSHPMYGKKSAPDYSFDKIEKKQGGEYVLEVIMSHPEGVSGQFFLIQKEEGQINLYTKKQLMLKRGEKLHETATVGIVGEGQLRRDFLNYIERERARPYKQFLHYNSWYDLSEDNVSYNLDDALSVIQNWGEKFIEPYHVDFGGFALDDGWDDLNDLWRFNHEDFPDGFVPLAEEAKKYRTNIGAWMSPFGGYAESKLHRIETALRDGFEITDKGLSLAGPKYYDRFLESALSLISDNGVNYFKFDGFGGADPKYLPEMEAATKMVTTLRQKDPNVFVNVTTGTWPSPSWLFTADCTWKGGWDADQAGVGNNTQRLITYRDGTLYNNVVRRAPLYPLNAVMLHGVIYANRSWGKKYTTDENGDFADQVFSYFGSGTSLQELYISHDRMNKTKWAILARAARWAKANEDVFVDTHWVGGDPFNLDVYGWASWNGEKGIITLRNPSDMPRKYDLDLAKTFETDQVFGKYRISEPFLKKPSNLTIMDEKVKIILEPFEGKIMEISQK